MKPDGGVPEVLNFRFRVWTKGTAAGRHASSREGDADWCNGFRGNTDGARSRL